MSQETFPFGAASRLLAQLGVGLLVGACGPESKDDAPACTVTAPLACPEPATHFPDVASIFQNRCATAACHSGTTDDNWPLISYEDVESWSAEVRVEVLHCSMPPPDSGMSISNPEREAILTWVKCGALE